MTSFIASLKYGPEHFDFTDEGTLNRYLGVEIEGAPGRPGFTMMQPFLIERILDAVNIDMSIAKSRDVRLWVHFSATIVPIASHISEGEQHSLPESSPFEGDNSDLVVAR